MGQTCTRVPMHRPSSDKKAEPSHERRSSLVSAPESSQPVSQTASSTPTPIASQLCNHIVCSILRKKDWAEAQKMLESGEGIDITSTKFLERALYEGAPKGIIDLIIKNGADPLDSSRCLSDAILGKVDIEVVKMLLDKGCSPNQQSAQDKLRRTPMHFACQTNTDPAIVDLLIEHGGLLNIAVGEREWTPLHYLACANHDANTLRRVVLLGANVNAQASDGTTPMILAAYKNAPLDFIRALLEVNADPSLQTSLGRTPLYFLNRQTEAPVHPDDLRLILLDPQIFKKQMQALVCGLHNRLGMKSPIHRLNKEILRLVSKFVFDEKQYCSDGGEYDDTWLR